MRRHPSATLQRGDEPVKSTGGLPVLQAMLWMSLFDLVSLQRPSLPYSQGRCSPGGVGSHFGSCAPVWAAKRATVPAALAVTFRNRSIRQFRARSPRPLAAVAALYV